MKLQKRMTIGGWGGLGGQRSSNEVAGTPAIGGGAAAVRPTEQKISILHVFLRDEFYYLIYI